MPFEEAGALHLKGQVEIISNDSLSALINLLLPLITVGGEYPHGPGHPLQEVGGGQVL